MKVLFKILSIWIFCASIYSAPYLTNKVWLVIYDPIPSNTVYEHLWDYFDKDDSHVLWNDPFRQNENLLKLLTMDTHTNIAFICTRTNIFRFFPRLNNGQRYYFDRNGAMETNNYYWSYTSPWKKSFWKRSRFDFVYMMTNDLVDAERIMGTGECDNIWIWAPEGYVGYESLMLGPGAGWCNSWPGDDNIFTNYPKRFIIYCYNYERGTDMANHDFGHAIESCISVSACNWDWTYASRFDSNKYLMSPWFTFAATDIMLKDHASCGDCHRMPNSTNDYQYRSTDKVWSYHENWQGTNWYSWPKLYKSNLIDHTAWTDPDFEKEIYTSEGECSHLRWWFQHMPHEQPSSPYYMTNGMIMNWYEYIWNINSLGFGLTEKVLRYEGPYCDLRGFAHYYIDVPCATNLNIKVEASSPIEIFVRKNNTAIPESPGVHIPAYDLKSCTGSNVTLNVPADSSGRWYITVKAPTEKELVRGEFAILVEFTKE